MKKVRFGRGKRATVIRLQGEPRLMPPAAPDPEWTFGDVPNAGRGAGLV